MVSPIAHIFGTSGWNNIAFGSQGDIEIIHSFPNFDLGMTPCDFELFLGGGLQQEDHLGEKGATFRACPQIFLLLGASYSVY